MMHEEQLRKTAQELVPPTRGILAADESTGTATRRLNSVGVESTPESRRAYRKMLMTTPDIEKYLSGVILYDETIRQTVEDDTTFPDYLKGRGIIPGIKVDTGSKDLALFPGEEVTEGLDGLRERLAEYWELGARFAKWRAVIRISDTTPTPFGLAANAHALARYAALCQEAGLVPIVEPEVLINGDHSIERAEEVTTDTLNAVFGALKAHRVLLEGMLLKPSMVISGNESGTQASHQEVAKATIRCFKRSVPAAVPGVVFLSGGQSPERATANLNAINQMGDHPWEVSFSFARALQGPAMEEWRGKKENVQRAQELFRWRAKLASAARQGEYSPEMEKEP